MTHIDYDRARKILHKAADMVRQQFSATDAEMITLMEEIQLRFAGKPFQEIVEENLPADPWRNSIG